MATTRLKVTNGLEVYHRIAAADDAPQVDVATSDADAAGLGSIGDFQLQADAALTYTTRNGVVGSGSDFSASAGSIADGFYYIKHTGFQDAAKTTATTSYLKICVGQSSSSTDTFSIYPGESMTFHAPFGAGIDSADDYILLSSSGDIFVEITTAT